MVSREIVLDLLHASSSSDTPSSAVEAYLTTLPPLVIHSLTTSLHHPPSPATSLTLLRALWSASPLRPSLLSCICHPPSPAATDIRLLDEVDLLLAGNARSAHTSEHARLRSLGRCATAIVRAARDAGGEECVGIVMVSCARAAAAMGTRRARQVSEKMLKWLVVYLRGKGQGVRGVAALLESDLRLGAADERALWTAVDAVAGGGGRGRELPALFRAVLVAMGRGGEQRAKVLGRVCLLLVRRAGEEGQLGDMLVTLGVAVGDVLGVAERLVEAMEEMFDGMSATERLGLECERVRVGTAHVSVVYYMLGCVSREKVCERLGRLLERVVVDKGVKVDTAQAGSSAAHAEQEEGWRRLALKDGLKVAAVREQGEAVARFLEAQLWGRGKGIPRRVCVEMLYEVFLLIPGCRAMVLSTVFTACINRSTSKAILTECCGLLERLTDTRRAALLLRDHAELVLGCLKYVGFMPVPFDCRVVSAVARFAMRIPVRNDELFLFLRKATASRRWKLQRAACSGLMAVVEDDDTADDTQKEACETLGHMLHLSESTVRSYIVGLLVSFLERAPAKVKRIRKLCELVVGRVMALEREGVERDDEPVRGKSVQDSAHFDLSQSFEVAGSDYFARDNLPLMLVLCAKFRAYCERTSGFFAKLVAYLSDPERAVRDACSSVGVVSVSAKISQLVLVVEALLCVDPQFASSSLLQTYSITLCVRHRLPSEQIERGRRDRGLETDGRDESAIFAAMAGQVATFSEAQVSIRSLLGIKRTLMAYISVLETCLNAELDQAVLGVLHAEILAGILSILHDAQQERETVSWDETTVSSLVSLIAMCFKRNCSWAAEMPSFALQEGRLSTNESDMTRLTENDSRQNLTVEKPSTAHDEELDPERTPWSFASLQIADENAQDTLDTAQLLKLQTSTLLIARHLSVKILLFILEVNEDIDPWSTVVSFTAGVTTKLEKNLPRSEDSGTGTESTYALMVKHLNAGAEEPEIDAMLALSQVFCSEFEHSLSIALTSSYMELYWLLLRRLSRCGKMHVRLRTVEIVTSVITGLLRDYSIRHLQILRTMLKLLFETLEKSPATQFATSIMSWLGNDPCLLSFKKPSLEDAITSEFHGREFDVDILEEALAFDREHDSDGPSLSEHREHAHEKSGSAESTNERHTEDAGEGLQRTVRTQIIEKDPVKSLCFNETEQSGLLALTCAVEQISRIVKQISERFRRSLKQTVQATEEDMTTLKAVLTGFREFFETPFAEMTSPRNSHIPAILRKKISNVILLLIETSELLLQMLIRQFQESTTLDASSPHIIQTSSELLQFLSDEKKCCFILNSIDDQDPRRAFLQERLDSTSAAFLLCSLSKKRVLGVSGLRSSVQKRLRKMKVGAQRRENKSDIQDSLVRSPFTNRQQKKQKTRSRNPAVDGWLHQERGDDNYADLEEFIVPMDDDL